MRAALEGLLAGWAIAVPVGAIGVLILDRAASRGFGPGAAAALGVASADFFYATVAVVAGGAAATLIPDHPAVPAVSAIVLAAVGMSLLWSAVRPTPAAARPPAVRGHGGTVAAFFGMTVINPVTVLYFAALVTGLDQAVLGSVAQRVAFAVAAFIASLSWQLALAWFGAAVGSRMSPTAARGLRITGALLVLGFAVRIGLRAPI